MRQQAGGAGWVTAAVVSGRQDVRAGQARGNRVSEIAAAGVRREWRSRPGAGAEAARAVPDARRLLQLALAGLWLLDGVLQYQAFMFSRGFSDMLAGMASGNPGVVASPITWDADRAG